MCAAPAASPSCGTRRKMTTTIFSPSRAIAKEIRQRGAKTECSVCIAAGLPLASFGREKKAFRDYLLYSYPQKGPGPVCFRFEGIPYRIEIQDVRLFPQGYSALAIHPEVLQNEPSVLLMDIGGWTVDLMRLDNGVPNAATCRSLEFGMIRCIDEVKEQVRRDVGLSVTDAQVEQVLAGEALQHGRESPHHHPKAGPPLCGNAPFLRHGSRVRSERPCRWSCWAAAHRWPGGASRRRTACAALFSSRTRR